MGLGLPLPESTLALADHRSILADACRPVAAETSELSVFLVNYLQQETKSATAHSIIEHVFAAGGKRVRPSLYFLSCNLAGYKGPHRIPMAAVCEYVHTASLLHDDVVDNSTIRRGKPTSNTIWGDESAVLVGDLIYSTASRLMASSGQIEIVDAFAKAITQMSEGELLQLEAIGNLDLSEESYFDILGGKTAVLIGTACRSAGLLAELPTTKTDALFRFGFYTGLAFQVVDDVLDYICDEDITGKPLLSDLREGKVTLPLIEVRNQLSPPELKAFQNLLNQNTPGHDSIVRLAEVVCDKKGIIAALDKAQSFTYQALDALHEFPASLHRDRLSAVAKALLNRVY